MDSPRHDYLEPIQDGLGDTVFQGRAMHIPLEALVLGDPTKEDLRYEKSTLLTQTTKMVHKGFMAQTVGSFRTSFGV